MAVMMASETRTTASSNESGFTKTRSLASSSSSVSSLSSASGNSLSTLSKLELDRLIAENMTSVLKSLKKRKHAKKHARLRQAAAAAEGDAHEDCETKKTPEASPKSDAKMNRKEKKESGSRRGRKSEKMNGNNNSEQGSKPLPKHGLKEVQPETNDGSSAAEQASAGNGSNQQPVEKTGKENKTINAFQLMMTARSKCIGSNSPGREREVEEMSPSQQLMREKKAQRVLQLQQWAAQKGSGKRKLNDEAEGEYIDRQMKKRAKRLKKLISNMGQDENTDEEETTKHVKVEIDTDKVIFIENSGDSTKASNENGQQPNEKRPENSTEMSVKKTELKDKPSRPRGRKKKNSSTKVEEVVALDDSSRDNFLNQLSSPTKKKDSLLGYFPKVTPETLKKENSHAVSPNDKLHSDQDTPVLRPRRSCANRIKDYSAFESYSPAKEEQKSVTKKLPIVTPLKIINVQSPNAMKVVKSPSLRMFSSTVDDGNVTKTVATATTPKSVVLAPVFARRQRSAIDEEKARARQTFLMSGIPEKMRQHLEKRAIYEEHVLNDSPVFPLVSHVMQLEPADALPSLREVNFNRGNIKVRPAEPDSPPKSSPLLKAINKNRKIRFGSFTACTGYDYEDALERCIDPPDLDVANGELVEVSRVKEIVRDYKKRYPHFPVFRCYKQFSAIYKEYQPPGEGQKDPTKKPLQSNTRRNSENTMDNSVEIIEPSYSSRNGELLFTEKYKPQNTEQILINFSPANLLSKFLALWQDDSSGQRTTNGSAQLYGDSFISSGEHDDDFELSNGSYGGLGAGVCNHIVLVGPPGCGKTCNVYAVAKEMNFNVLEINASSRRKGKIILQELLEATQSHQVRQKTERSNSTDGSLGRPVKGGKKNGLNGVFRCLERRPSFNDTNGNGSKKLSLILIEDADIVFDQDDGFLGAINQLIATSKRPIVLTTTNPSCAHMARYMARNNVIRYMAPGIGNVAKFLSLLALVERIPIDQHDLGRLYAYNGKDIRKTLNELQFFVQSGGDMERFQSENGSTVNGATLEEELNTALNETREEDDQSDEDHSQAVAKPSKGRKKRPKKDADPPAIRHHGTLYDLFTRNQNEEMVLRLPVDFNALWCNMVLVLRTNDAAATPKEPRKGKRNSPAGKRGSRCNGAAHAPLPPDVRLSMDLSVLYENISRAETGWSVTQRNRIRYGKDLQDDQQQQQLANEMGHALVEGCWIDWFARRGDRTGQTKSNEAKASGGAKAYDALRKLEHEPRQTISSYIGLNGVRSRVTSCDYEPMLRQICRHERDRSTQERRGTRFYHYLRNFVPANGIPQQQLLTNPISASGGINVDYFDALSHCFEEQQRVLPEPGEGNGG